MNYYRRYSGDYLRKTARLSFTEHGAYGLMLDYYYAEERPLPLDHEEIFIMCRALKPADRAAIVKILGLFFEKKNDGYHNARADEEITKAAPAIKAARDNGSKGGRRPNPSGNPPGYSDVNPPDNPLGSSMSQPIGLATGQHAGQHPPSSNHQPLTTNPKPPTANRQETEEARASRLPKNWALPDEWGKWAVENHGWSGAHTMHVAECFRDYWIAKPGKDGRKTDWEATWRNWCRNQRGNGAAKGGVVERNAQAAQEWLNGGEPRAIDG